MADSPIRLDARRRRARRARVELLASRQEQVVSRLQLYAEGITRWEVRANVRAGRWQTFASQSVVVHTGPLTDSARRWAAVFEAGPRAFLDGASALQAAGLERFSTDVVRVSVPRGARVRRASGVDIRQTRRWDAGDLASGGGPPRSRTETAAIRAALWARSDRQAALVLTMAVQQGLVEARQLGVELLRVRRDRRRRLVGDVLLDLVGGARSLGEIDFARECRRRGLPEPTRQAVRRGPDGRYYLDVVWEQWRVAVEIDGIQHAWAENVVQDALRHNAVTLGDCRVLRLPVLGLRVAADAFFAQVEEALRASGWARTA
jgi:very-short-patch-repair endonuclease